MSAFKKLKKTDAFVTTYVAKKNWYYSGSASDPLVVDLASLGIQAVAALTSSNNELYLSDTLTYDSQSAKIENQGTFNRELTYRSINQLYYSNYNNDNGSILDPYYLTQAKAGTSITSDFTSSARLYENYEQNSLTLVEDAQIDNSGSRYLRGEAMVYSFPREIIGTHIEPGSFKMIPKYDGSIIGEYVHNLYHLEGYVSSGDESIGADDGYLGGLEAIVDDGEGNLKLIQSEVHTNIGNIIYPHGIVVLTNLDVARYFSARPELGILTWKSNQPIYTYNYHAKISDFEFNHTLNKTALTGSDNRLRDNVSGSSFQPYITTVGLYNDANELIAVGKLSQPLQKPADTELTIQVKLDI